MNYWCVINGKKELRKLGRREIIQKKKKEREKNVTFFLSRSRFIEQSTVMTVLDYGDVGRPLGRLFTCMAFK